MAGLGNLLRRSLVAPACALAAALVFAPAAVAEEPDPGSGYHVASATDAGVAVERGAPDRGELRSVEPRIVGGRPVDIAEVPWQTALVVNPALVQPGTDTQGRQICGGSLAAPNVVITAAHCIFTPDGTALEFTPDQINVITGRTVLNSNEGQELPVVGFYLFVDAQGEFAYDAETSAFDVAILHLGANSTTGTPIQIPGPGEEPLWEPGRTALVSGWGHTRSNGQGSDQLLATEVFMTPDGICDLVYRRGFTATSTCAGVFGGGRDSCQGDSGGPLVVPTAQGAVRLAGDVQSGRGCADPRTPGIYGRLGSDPLRSGLQQKVAELSGVNVVGSGATAPTTITVPQGENLALNRAELSCAQNRKCRSFNADRCKAFGSGVQCRERLFLKLRKGKKKNCNQNVVFAADTGTITEDPAKKKCKKKK